MTLSCTRADISAGTPADAVAHGMQCLYARDDALRYSASLSIEVRNPKGMEVIYLRVLNKRRGQAGRIMDELTRLADLHGVSIVIEAKAMPEMGGHLGQRDLEAFYGRRGFMIVGCRNGSTRMRREVGRNARDW